MPSNKRDARDQLDLIRSLPLDDTAEEKVETLWRQVMVYKSFADSDLSEAKARRAQAEMAREQAELESVKTTKELCDRMRAEAQHELEEARRIKAETARERQDIDAALSRIDGKRAQAEAERDDIIADAQRKAQEIAAQTLTAAQQETTAFRRQALKDIRTVLNRVEDMRAAVTEELETQRILTNVARMKTSARHLFADAVSKDVEEQETEPPAAAEQTVGAETEPPAAAPEQAVDVQPEPTKAEEAREPAQKSRKGKGPSRKS